MNALEGVPRISIYKTEREYKMRIKNMKKIEEKTKIINKTK